MFQRGRTAFMYALDKVNSELPIEVFQYMLKKGADITERDCVRFVLLYLSQCLIRLLVFWEISTETFYLFLTKYNPVTGQSPISTWTVVAQLLCAPFQTGCNPRDIARFARRQDVVDLIDKVVSMYLCTFKTTVNRGFTESPMLSST